MLHANISSPDVCWRIPNTNWQAHLELCHRNPDTFERPDTMLNQSRYPSQLRGNAHLCKLKTARTVESFSHREILSFQTNHYYLGSVFMVNLSLTIVKRSGKTVFCKISHLAIFALSLSVTWRYFYFGKQRWIFYCYFFFGRRISRAQKRWAMSKSTCITPWTRNIHSW